MMQTSTSSPPSYAFTASVTGPTLPIRRCQPRQLQPQLLTRHVTLGFQQVRPRGVHSRSLGEHLVSLARQVL
jgi:hypothetical protein